MRVCRATERAEWVAEPAVPQSEQDVVQNAERGEELRGLVSARDAAARNLEGKASTEYVEGYTSIIRREPLGIVAGIAPWNYPYLTAVNSIIPALMSGNAVVLKHAASTILVAERFQKAFDRAKLPKGIFQHLVLSHKQTSEIISGGLANMVCFTGSGAGGKAISQGPASAMSASPALIFSRRGCERSGARGSS